MDLSTWNEGDVAVSDGLTCAATLARGRLVQPGTRTSVVQLYTSAGELLPEQRTVHARRVIVRAEVPRVQSWLDAVGTVDAYMREHGQYVTGAELHAAYRAVGTMPWDYVYARVKPAGFRASDLVKMLPLVHFNRLLAVTATGRRDLVEPVAEHDDWMIMTSATLRQLARRLAAVRPAQTLATRDPRNYRGVNEVIERWCLPHLPDLAAAKSRLEAAQLELRLAQSAYAVSMRALG